MQIIHHIGLYASEEDQAKFSSAGVDIPLGLTSFDISEDDPRWPQVESVVEERDPLNIIWTKFNKEELYNSRYLTMDPTWHQGFPQPESNFRYREISYDPSTGCKKCGIGYEQAAPFRFKKAPAWGKKSVLQLNWVWDEYFVTPEAYIKVFEPLGIGSKPVLLHKTERVLDSVLQLDIPVIIDLNYNNIQYEMCPVCHRRKYQHVTRGFYPKPAETKADIFKSSEYFGSGGDGGRLILVSNRLFRAIVEAGLKGVEFGACTS